MDSIDIDVALKIGIQGVDDQHRAIAAMVDVVSSWSETETRAESISSIMTTIGRLIREHFNSEEKVLEQLGVPTTEVDAHKDDHTRLINEYVDLLMFTINGKPVPPSRLGAFLRGWLTDHIISHDLKIRDHLARHMRAPELRSQAATTAPSPFASPARFPWAAEAAPFANGGPSGAGWPPRARR